MGLPAAVADAMYRWTSDPPVSVARVQVTFTARPSDGCAEAALSVGAPGAVIHVADRAVEESLVPAALVAVTVTEYVTPFVSVDSVHSRVGGVALQVRVV